MTVIEMTNPCRVVTMVKPDVFVQFFPIEQGLSSQLILFVSFNPCNLCNPLALSDTRSVKRSEFDRGVKERICQLFTNVPIPKGLKDIVQ